MVKAKKSFTKLKVFHYKEDNGGKSYEENIKWVKEIKKATESHRFKPYFQPIVDTKTKETVKFEALLRYKSEDGKEISPIEFLDIAKKSRMYYIIIRIVLNESIEVIKRYNINISINISYEDIINKETLKYIYQTLKDNPDEAKRIDFEILESEIIDDFDIVKEFIDNIKLYGCGVGIDDFGSGYSNFNILDRLNVDFIKIDGSLVKNIANHSRQRLIVDSINSFSHKLGISTVAEMVSDENSYEIIKELGIDYAQGWYFAKAVDESELSKYV
jgi:EAL domain-containing protein (putative c-di-GMP-specific phosphodiesterase class I)